MSTAVEELRSAVRAGRNDVRLLVPTATLAEHRRHQLAREGLVFRPDLIQTLSSFAAGLAKEVRQVSEPLFLVTVDRSIQALRPPEFEPVSDAPGFAASMADTIRRLDSIGVTHRDIAGICGDWPYAKPLARVWAAAERSLAEHGLALRTGVLRAAEGKHSGIVLLDGFAKFSAPESRFLQSLGVAPVVEPTANFAAGEERFAADSDVREAEEIARRILEGGMPFREVGIALRDPERYVGVLRTVLERFGIPARFYFSEPLSSSAAARLFAGTVEAFLSGWDHETLLPVLRLYPRYEPAIRDELDFAMRERMPDSGLEALRAVGAGRLADQLAVLEWNWRRRLTPLQWADQLANDFSRIYRFPGISAAPVRTFEAALREAAELDSAAVSLADFWATAKTVMNRTALRIPDKRRNVVHVMSVYEARQWTLDTIFVCGLAEKAFPKRHPQNAFLPDAAMEMLKRAGFGVPTSGDLGAEEEELFRMVCASARRRIVLSYATEQKDGPSVFWGTDPGVVGGDMQAPGQVRPALRKRRDARRRTPRIADPALLTWIGERHPAFSVTWLENYLGCPFKYFSLNLMGLKSAPARPEKRLTFLEEGNIAHKALENWLRERGEIRPVLDQVFESACEAKRIARGYRTEHSYARMLGNLERFVHTPWPQNNVLPAERNMEFAITDGVRIKARVDRIERQTDGRLIVIDYKYSNALNTKGKVEDETKLQGPLYVRGLEANGEDVAAMVYFSLKTTAEVFGWGEISGLGHALEPLTREWIEKGVAEARRAVEQIRSGRIQVRDGKGDPCTYCDAKDACRVETESATFSAGAA